MGRIRVLSPATTLHVTNGDSVAETLRRTALDGVVLPWRDALHVGPLANVPAADFRRLRAQFLSDRGWGDPESIEAEMARRDELLFASIRDGHLIVLWFEHDLYDQLQLLQVLTAAEGAAPGQVELVQSTDYLGSLDERALEALWSTRKAVGPEVFAVARSAWEALCSGDLGSVLERDTSALPHLRAALLRLAEEREPLSRTKRQLLQSLADRPQGPLEVFAANQAKEEAVFLGDAWAFRDLFELAEGGLVARVGGGTIPVPPPPGDASAFGAVEFELTAAGRAALANGS